MHFSVLIGVGPGKHELERLSDLLESLYYFEPETSCVVIIDDGDHGTELKQVTDRFPSQIHILDQHKETAFFWKRIIPLPYGAKKKRLGIYYGFKWILNNIEHTDFILKLDTDSLIINPFSEKIIKYMKHNPKVGQVGCFKTTPNNASQREIHYFIRKKIEPITKTFWYYPKYDLICTLFGSGLKRKQIAKSAIKNGLTLGDHCQGGGYAVFSNALEKFKEKEIFNDAYLFARFPVAEDPIITLCVYGVGFTASDFNRKDEPFGIRFKGLHTSPSELVELGFSIIHSTKGSDEYTEQDIRSFFKKRRDSKFCSLL
jgi:hypothetical protein